MVLHFDGRPLSNEYVATHFDAIMEVWQPGMMGGQALCKVLFGEYSPAGRLPVTAARNAGQLPVYYALPRGSGYRGAGHTGMIRNKNGYINDTAFPLYDFGYGLSYTTFEYSQFRAEKEEVHPDETICVCVNVRNTGNVEGDEVVQLYVSDDVSSMVRPERELAGFGRVSLKPGEEKTVFFEMKASQLAFLDEQMRWTVEKGSFTLMVGASCEDIRQSLTVTVSEGAEVNCRTRGFYAKAYSVLTKAAD